MSRPVRIEYPGAYYYISSQGVEGDSIFRGIKDRREFLDILQSVVARMQWQVFAYNLLPDSYQLFIKTPKANLSKGMRQLNGVYTQRYNSKYERHGNIFHGRFKAVLVEEELFTDVLQHVLHMPVLQAKVRQLKQWKWSNYQAAIGLAEDQPWLNTDTVLSHFGKQKKRSQTALSKAMSSLDRDFDISDNIQGQILLGSESFVKKWKKQLATGKVMEKALKRQAKKVKPLADYETSCKDSRSAMIKAYKTGNYTLEQIGRYFDVHYSTVSRAVKQSGF